MYDLFGRMIMERKVLLHTGDNNMDFDFSPYPSGVYLSKVIIDGKVYELKITKQE
jgi:hypothetical protein